MKKLRRKLNSENGAVMVIALLFFIVCMLVSAVIVSAAGMNASRIEKRYDEQKAYLAASSAAQLLRENLAGMTFKAEKTDKEYTCTGSHSDKDGTWQKKQACDNRVYFNTFITDSAMQICKGNTTDSYTMKYTLNEDRLSDVTTNVSVEMHTGQADKYDVECIIKSDTGGSSYTMSLYVKANGIANESTSEFTDDEHTSSLGSNWEKREYVYYKGWVYSYKYTITTTTLTVTWPEGTIQKGDAQ